MDIDAIAKIAQTTFYVVGGTVAVLTYLKAKNGLLNTINTEYHKKVIERLAAVSEELYKEFDYFSDKHWIKDESVKEVLDCIHKELVPHKENVIAEGIKDPPIPISKRETELGNLLDKYRSDPFLPEEIRDRVVKLLQKRCDAMSDAFMETFENYQLELGKGKHWETLDTNVHWLHNQIVDSMSKRGAGISDVEREVHEIRLAIQKYFKRFNPLS